MAGGRVLVTCLSSSRPPTLLEAHTSEEKGELPASPCRPPSLGFPPRQLRPRLCPTPTQSYPSGWLPALE